MVDIRDKELLVIEVIVQPSLFLHCIVVLWVLRSLDPLDIVCVLPGGAIFSLLNLPVLQWRRLLGLSACVGALCDCGNVFSLDGLVGTLLSAPALVF